MRLLNVHSLEFRESYSRPIPSYAIASHRWASGEGEDREATYLDIKEGKNTNTTGFEKVRSFAEFVRTRIPNVKWLWVDTCCINKQDAQELTEAINSMYRWYRESAVCIAWMADVSTADDQQGFKSSEWFKRGWTLQELLAPRAMIFLSRDYQIMGHKASDTSRSNELSLDLGPSLNASITQITGIPENVLRDFQNGKSLSVEERVAWMENRRTTREEDMWYSLIGILDAPMVAIYGEGEDHARRRLLAEASRDDSYLEKLPIAQGAAFDDRENELVSECLPDTRVDLIKDINIWAGSKEGQCIFWLVGMAGTGKSTIFKTVAQRFRDRCHLAASFCFKKGEADRERASQLIPTIAAQLARQLPEVRQRLISVLKENPDVVRKSLREQFQSLILQPLEHVNPLLAGGSAWVIGIDALDECDDETDIRIVIDLFAKLEKLRAADIRLFVTSRPELPVRLGFRSISENTHLDIRLEEVTKDHIEHDITIYLRHKLIEIRAEHAGLYDEMAIANDWPGDDVIKALVDMAQPLFIFAATACRLLGEHDEDPNENLRLILNHRLGASQLEKTYGPVLERLLLRKTERQRDEIAHDFRILVGAIVLLQDSLPAPALSRLLGVSEIKVHTRLSQLHSVLDVPAVGDRSRGVRPLHLSFRDYLTDPDTHEKTRFWIDEVRTHQSLAKQCLRLLMDIQPLQQDLCAVKKPGTRRLDVSREHVAGRIPADVAYACCYWVWHLLNGQEPICDDGQVHRFFQTHFLHWLEALSWLGKLSEAISFLHDLPQLVKAEQGDQLLAFLADARRFLLRNRYVIDLAPLQIYSAALVFAPTQSIVRRQFGGSIPKWVQLGPKVTPNWNARIQALEGHFRTIAALAFSPDGKLVASGSHDCTARLWNALTGEEVCKLEGHVYPVLAVAFSTDRQTVATASRESMRLWNARTGDITHHVEMRLQEDRLVSGIVLSPDMKILAVAFYNSTVRLLNTSTGDEVHELTESDGFHGMSFSPDGKMVAVGSGDRWLSDRSGVRLYNSSTGEKMYELAWRLHSTTALAFSPEGTFLASGYENGTVYLSNTSTGEDVYELEGHGGMVTVIAFSLDGHMLASSTLNECIVWDVHRREKRNEFESHDQAILSLAFSPDGQTLVSGSKDGTIKLWDILVRRGSEILDGHGTLVSSVSFSPDGQQVVTGGLDNTLRLWDAQTGIETQKLEGHSQYVSPAKFFPDGQRIASGSGDKTIRLWDARTGEEIRRLEGHDGVILSIAFSANGHLVSGSFDTTVRLWDTWTGEELRRFEGHDDIVLAVAISSDARIVASASADGAIHLWDARTGVPIHGLSRVGTVHSMVFSEDGTCLRTDSGSFDISPYVVPPPQGCDPSRRVPRLLLYGQWLRYLDRDLLWLPTEYRGQGPHGFDISGDTFVVGQVSGAVSFIRLNPDEHE